MPECVVCVIDTSGYMNNGDYNPSRMEAQIEAVQSITTVKLQKNPENYVGSIAAGSESKRILVTPTNDFGKILSGLHLAKVGGLSDFKQALLVAKLALANRVEKIYTQRIILFVGSPINMKEEETAEIINALKKNGIALDIVSFGEVVDNAKVLETFPAGMGEECTLVTVPAGPHVLLEMISKTPIIMRDGGLGAFNPEYDPEYAAAIRASMGEGNATYNEEEELAKAIAASLADMEDNNRRPMETEKAPEQQHNQQAPQEIEMDDEMKLAIKMSMEPEKKDEKKEEKKDEKEEKKDK
uniref:26S proteasome regulatory subunit RPN10, putative n=1 Tax=Entamoeba invadens TaxID=33085 RepID=S0B3P0_ENTIV|nr:26S proteasome regulatory subunit RPN10, putative [Entamoeba invadens]